MVAILLMAGFLGGGLYIYSGTGFGGRKRSALMRGPINPENIIWVSSARYFIQSKFRSIGMHFGTFQDMKIRIGVLLGKPTELSIQLKNMSK